MNPYSVKHYNQAVISAFVSAVTILALLFALFVFAEPTVSRAQADVSDEFYIRQIITDETSFIVQPNDVDMAGSINGVTGGQATGTTDFVVRSNNVAGYTVEIDFFDNAGDHAMRGDVTGGEEIRDYGGDVAGQPSLDFTASTAAQFAYTVTSETPGDTAQSFLDNGTACNISSGGGGSQNAGTCWKAPDTTPFEIVNRDSAASNGATSTLTFSVVVPSGADPVPQAETYTATATLSVFTQ